MSEAQMSVSVDQQHRYRALDSLRGVCAVMVVFHHIPGSIGSLTLVQHFYLFVDFFFVLSGFVIGTSYGDRLAETYSISRYMILRFFRVWPLHAFMLMIYLAFELIFASGVLGTASRQPFEGDFSILRFIESVSLVSPFFGPDGVPWNGPAWSIAVEFWAYLIFAIAIKIAPRLIVPLCLAALLIAPVILALGSDRTMYVFHDGALVRCLFGFSAGVLLWKLPKSIREYPLGRISDHALELGAVVLCLVFLWFAASDRLSLAAPATFFLVVAVFSREQGFLSKILLTSPMLLLGVLSYSIYMVHWFIISRYINILPVLEKKMGFELLIQGRGRAELVGDPTTGAVLIGVLMCGIFIAAFLTQRFIEMPGQKIGRNFAFKLFSLK